MKKAIFFTLLSMLSIAVSPSYAKSADVRTVTIVNHFNDTLNLTVSAHREIVPDVSEKFSLRQNNKVTTRVLIGEEGANEAYFIVEGEQDPDNHEAFWGVDSSGIHGYMDTGIAYSWNNNRLATITFCSPDEYSQNGKCL